MAKIIFIDLNEEFDVPDGSGLTEPCQKVGIPFACSEGVCGSCIVEVVEGMENLTEYTQEEEDFLGPLDTERLACQCSIKQGTVKLKF